MIPECPKCGSTALLFWWVSRVHECDECGHAWAAKSSTDGTEQ